MKGFFQRVNRIFNFILPPPKWQFTVILLSGIIIGIGIYIFFISNAVSYLSDDPRACINCHVMTTQYATWQRSSHGRVTNCNDCHVPHNNFVSKYLFKAQDGMRHATIFTFRWEPQVIRIKEAGASVVQQNCIRCHQNMISKVSISRVTYTKFIHGEGLLCWSCHRETPHGRVRSLSATPFARVPRPSSVLPEWLKEKSNQTK